MRWFQVTVKVTVEDENEAAVIQAAIKQTIDDGGWSDYKGNPVAVEDIIRGLKDAVLTLCTQGHAFEEPLLHLESSNIKETTAKF